MTPTIAVIDAPVVDPVRVLSILLRCKASRFLIDCRDSRYREPLNPAEPATANALNVGNFPGTQSQHVGSAGDALLLGARFSCAKAEDPASSSVAIVTGRPAPARRIRAHNPAIVESTPMAAPIPPNREGEHFSHYVPLDRKPSKSGTRRGTRPCGSRAINIWTLREPERSN